MRTLRELVVTEVQVAFKGELDGKVYVAFFGNCRSEGEFELFGLVNGKCYIAFAYQFVVGEEFDLNVFGFVETVVFNRYGVCGLGAHYGSLRAAECVDTYVYSGLVAGDFDVVDVEVAVVLTVLDIYSAHCAKHDRCTVALAVGAEVDTILVPAVLSYVGTCAVLLADRFVSRCYTVVNSDNANLQVCVFEFGTR